MNEGEFEEDAYLNYLDQVLLIALEMSRYIDTLEVDTLKNLKA